MVTVRVLPAATSPEFLTMPRSMAVYRLRAVRLSLNSLVLNFNRLSIQLIKLYERFTLF